MYYNLAAGRGDATARRTRRARARPRVAPRARVLYSVQACSFGRIVRTFCSPANSTPDPHEQCEKLSPRCAMAPFCVSDVLIHRVNPGAVGFPIRFGGVSYTIRIVMYRECIL